jgi:chemotaxis signal transduction protein
LQDGVFQFFGEGEKMENFFNGVTFRLYGETFAVDALSVREIVGGMQLKPNSTEGEGQNSIQVRGKEVPVLDLREGFGFPAHVQEGLNSFIVVQRSKEEKNNMTALWIDTVLEIVQVPAKELKPLTDRGGDISPRLIKAVMEKDGVPVYVINVDEILGVDLPEEKELVFEKRGGER